MTEEELAAIETAHAEHCPIWCCGDTMPVPDGVCCELMLLVAEVRRLRSVIEQAVDDVEGFSMAVHHDRCVGCDGQCYRRDSAYLREALGVTA